MRYNLTSFCDKIIAEIIMRQIATLKITDGIWITDDQHASSREESFLLDYYTLLNSLEVFISLYSLHCFLRLLGIFISHS